MKSAWLIAFHRQWQAARGSRLEKGKVTFSRDWEALIDSSGLHTAEDRKHAEDEARVLACEGRLKLVLHRHRHLRRVQLPLEQEEWLRAIFGSAIAGDLLTIARSVLSNQRARSHPRCPDEWTSLCDLIEAEFAAGRNLRPFFWRKPDTIAPVMDLVRDLTTKDWPPFTLVRDVDVLIGRATKTIEHHQRVIEAAMSQLFQRDMTLDGLGIVSSNSEVRFHGPLTLHFADGTQQRFDGNLQHESVVSAADIDRAAQVSTTARLLFTVENRKTTFRHVIAANRLNHALVITTSFPTRAVTFLLQKLPLCLPHQHFGDTDPAGYLILLKLRQLTARPVDTFEMDWLDGEGSPVLTEYDRRVLALMLDSSQMNDNRDHLTRMLVSGRRGRFEQEDRMALPDFGRTG